MQIPKNAKRVYKGEIFEVWQYEQKEFDGSVKTYEMIKRLDTIQIIAIKGDKLLLLREQQPNHTREVGLLGGRGEEGEDPLEAAKRELMEEAGMEADFELWRVYEPFTKIDHKIFYFIARNLRKVAEPKLEPGEKIEIKEVNFEEFIEKVPHNYWGGEFVADILRLRLEPKKLQEFKKKLLG